MPEGQPGSGTYRELEAELALPPISPVDPETEPEYISDKRVHLGPSADFSHDEFGRANRTDETFRVVRVITETDDHFKITVTEYTYDHNGRLVYRHASSDHMCQPDMRST